jgi:hypothetical protein
MFSHPALSAGMEGHVSGCLLGFAPELTKIGEAAAFPGDLPGSGLERATHVVGYVVWH